MSDDSKSFVRALICVDARKRLTADKALEHRWMGREFPLSDRIPEDNLMDSVHESIAAYAEVSEFKKMALMVIAHQSSTDEIMALRKAFDAYDTNNGGTITFEEFKAAMMKANTSYTNEDIQQLFDSVDIGHDNGEW